MSKAAQLHRLQQVAGLLFESRLAELRQAAHARQQTEQQLAGLAQVATPDDDIPLIAAELSALSYQRWADVRRIELNQILARQTAIWIDSRDAARLAFAKSQALAGVAAKLTAERLRRG